jgi:hypothetical protein
MLLAKHSYQVSSDFEGLKSENFKGQMTIGCGRKREYI